MSARAHDASDASGRHTDHYRVPTTLIAGTASTYPLLFFGFADEADAGRCALTIETPAKHVIAIQVLRGIAASMVLFVHMDTELARIQFRPLGSGWLSTGVDIFFVISGFIMWTSVERRRGITGTAFLRDRLIRIVPLYWAVTAFVVATAAFVPAALNSTVLRPGHALASFLFFPARHPTLGAFWPILVPGWSLNYEMLFYVLFAVALVLSNGRKFLRFVAISGSVFAIFLIANALKSRIDVMNFYARPIILEFITGTILGVICTSATIKRSYSYVSLSLAGFALLWASTHYGLSDLTTVIGATLVVTGAVFFPPIPPNFLSRLGDASYSLYLTHAVVLSGSALAWQSLNVQLPWPVFVITATCCAIAVAFLLYYFFEVPVTRALKSYASRRSLTVGERAPSAPELKRS